MDANSPKPSQTGSQGIAAVTMLRAWLDQMGGNNRPAQVLALLAEDTARHMHAGHASPALDADTLRKYYYERYGGRMPETPASRWLSSTEVRRWWDARQAQLEQASRRADLGVIPVLTLQAGGGRGNTTLYRLDFQPLSVMGEASDDRPSVEKGTADAGLVRYDVEPAKAAWWLSPIIGKKPFRMKSWRGYLLVGTTALEALGLLLLWLIAFLTIRGSRPVSAGDLAYLLTTAVFSYLWVQTMRPLIRLPVDRVTVANDLLLASSQFHGQLKLARDATSKLAGGWFQLVRHHASCSICSGDVEIAEGGTAFPGRLVGRCGDSPLEHVFSFDPVTLHGRSLYPDLAPHPHLREPSAP